jgi:hypothetical protein
MGGVWPPPGQAEGLTGGWQRHGACVQSKDAGDQPACLPQS